MSDHGARVAAGRIGITVDEYRAREAIGEHWCALGKHWAAKPNAFRCRDCNNADARRRYALQRALDEDLRGVRYAGPAFSLTPKGAAATRVPSAAAPEGRPDAELDAYPVQLGSGHSNCPAVLGCREGRIPEGWVRSSEVAG